MIDFNAVSADGRPILDLKVEELSLRVDGKARVIHSINLVQVPGGQSGHDAAHPLLDSPFATNAAVDTGRTLIFVVDDESIRPGSERPTRQAASQFLAGLAPRDRVALFTVPHGGMKVDLTSDFDKVRTALGQITGQAPENESLSDAACRTRTDLQSIAGMLDSLAGGQAPVTVVFLTSTLTGSRSQVTMSRNSTTSPTGASLPGARTMGTCELQHEEFDKVAAAAMQARAHFYIIQPELNASARLTNPSGGTGVDPRVGGDLVRGTDSYEQGINDLAGVTAGEHYPLTSTGDNALIRIALETSAYYMVTFEPEDLERNGASHRVELKVSRPGVSLRALPAVLIPAATAASAPAVTTPKTMLGEMRAYRDLTLRSAAFTARYQTSGKIQIVAAFEPDDPLVTLTSAMVGIFDGSGKLVGSWVAQPADLEKANLAKTPVTAGLVAPPGKYRLRVAATDKSGRSGATDLDIDATLTSAGTLKMGSLALGRTKDNIFFPKLQFSDETVAIAYLELYGQRLADDRPVVVMFQVAKSPDGPALLVQPASVDETLVPDRFIVEAAIPLAALEPGDYVVRALIGNGVEGEPLGRVIRTLRKTAK
jgi:VWFA-related protein